MRMRSRGLLLFAASAVFGSTPSGAVAYSGPVDVAASGTVSPLGGVSSRIGGKRWPGRPVARITYYNSTNLRWPVKQAVAAWNSSGVPVRFVPAPKRRARLRIGYMPGPASPFAMGGLGTQGYLGPGNFTFDPYGRPVHDHPNRIWLSRLTHPSEPNYEMAGVAAHELGHVLGLDHEDRRCATMNSELWKACDGSRPCRLLEPDDIRGAIKRYGGHPKLPRPAFCPKPPSHLRVVGDPRAYHVTLEWRNPKGPFVDHVAVTRRKDRCPTDVDPSSQLTPDNNRPGRVVRLKDDGFLGASGNRLAVGRYCYALWTLGNADGFSRRKTIWVDFDPERPQPPTDLTATVAVTGEVALSWKQASHPELAGIVGGVGRDRCPKGEEDALYSFESKADGVEGITIGNPGHYCVVLWSRDTIGRKAGPAMVWIDYAGEPPSADFDYRTDSYSNVTVFYDRSYDADGEIVAWKWDFGDGVVNDGTDGQPSHTYAAPGTYTVVLTVRDDQGLTGSATHEVVVEPPQ